MIENKHIEEAKHAIGLDSKKPYTRRGKLFYKAYRNYFATYVTDKIWTELAVNDYAKHNEPNEKDECTYWLTDKGIAWLSGVLNIKITLE